MTTLSDADTARVQFAIANLACADQWIDTTVRGMLSEGLPASRPSLIACLENAADRLQQARGALEAIGCFTDD